MGRGRRLYRKRSRWDIESGFRDTQQLTGLSACQCWVPQAMERHVALVLVAFVVLQQARLGPSQTVGESKRSLHLRMIRGDEPVVGESIGHSKEGRIMRAP
jgi:SRSO17 transposase